MGTKKSSSDIWLMKISNEKIHRMVFISFLNTLQQWVNNLIWETFPESVNCENIIVNKCWGVYIIDVIIYYWTQLFWIGWEDSKKQNDITCLLNDFILLKIPMMINAITTRFYYLTKDIWKHSQRELFNPYFSMTSLKCSFLFFCSSILPRISNIISFCVVLPSWPFAKLYNIKEKMTILISN